MPSKITDEKPTWLALAQSSTAEHMAPDCRDQGEIA